MKQLDFIENINSRLLDLVESDMNSEVSVDVLFPVTKDSHQHVLVITWDLSYSKKNTFASNSNFRTFNFSKANFRFTSCYFNDYLR